MAKLVSVDNGLHLPSAVRNQLSEDLKSDMQGYVESAQSASGDAVLASDEAVSAADRAETARDEAVAIVAGDLDVANAVLINDAGSDTAQALAANFAPVQGLYANAIYNGSFDLYQAGDSVNPLVHLSRTADRWVYGQQGSGSVFKWERDTTDTPDSSVEASSMFSTVTASAISADQERHVRYAIEGKDFQAFANQTATLSFWVKGSTAGTYSIAFTNSGRDRTYIAEYSIIDAGTWEFKTVTLTFDAVDGGTWDYGGGQGIGIRFALAVGSNYAGTPNEWNTANVVGSGSQIDLGAGVGRYIKFAKVQLNIGSKALPYYHRTFAETFALCSRYYYVVNGVNVRRTPLSSLTTSSIVEIYTHLPSRMRAVPKVSILGTRGTDWYLRSGSDQTNTTGTLVAPSYGTDSGLLRFEGGTYTPGEAFHVLLDTISAKIVFDAEL